MYHIFPLYAILFSNKVLDSGSNIEPVLEEDVTEIRVGSFYNCTSLTSVTIPMSVTLIEGQAFESCALTSVPIPNPSANVDWAAFDYGVTVNQAV